MTFIDLEKANHRVLRKLIQRTLRNKYILNKYVEIIQDMYDGATTNIRTICKETTKFPIRVEIHQGLPYQFKLIIDDLTVGIRDEVSWCMLFCG